MALNRVSSFQAKAPVSRWGLNGLNFFTAAAQTGFGAYVAVWLTQQQMAGLFQTTKQNIGQHLRNLFAENELREESVVKEFFTTAADGKNYQTEFWNSRLKKFRQGNRKRN